MIDIKTLLINYLAAGKILIAIDSNIEGVRLPDHLMNSIQVKLNLSYKFETTIFEIDDEKVSVDLSFNGKRILCLIPFTSIYYVAMANNPLEGVEIIENMPIELLELSYALECHAMKQSEAASKEINFLEHIPSDKVIAIKSKMPSLEEKPKPSKYETMIKSKSPSLESSPHSKHDIEMFDELLAIMQDSQVATHLQDVASKVHKNHQDKNLRHKPKTKSNEIKFSSFKKDK